MAASTEYDIDFEELERLFIDDTTDEQFSFDEIEAISEPSRNFRRPSSAPEARKERSCQSYSASHIK